MFKFNFFKLFLPLATFCCIISIPNSEANDNRLINLNRLLKEKSCRNCNLESLDLTNIDLRGADLYEVNLSYSNLSGSILDNVDLRKSNLKDTVLVNSSLRGANMEGAKIENTDFRGSDLTEASFDYEALDNSFVIEAIGIKKEMLSLNMISNLGATYYTNRKYLKSIRVYEIAMDKNPMDGKAVLSKAIINYELGNINKSISDLHHAEKLYRDNNQEERANKILEFRNNIIKETKKQRRINLNLAKTISQGFLLFRLI